LGVADVPAAAKSGRERVEGVAKRPGPVEGLLEQQDVLQHQVEHRREPIDGASGQERRHQVGGVLRQVSDFRARQPGEAGVPVPVDVPLLLAERQVDLQSVRSRASPVLDVPCRGNKARPWRERRLPGAFHHRLVAVVQQGVAEAGSRSAVQKRQRVGKLVFLGHHRPFLGEAGGPLTVQPYRAEDVLEDTRFLVEGLLDEK
jgi:hypothetical protein